jgi:hypothetical protein
MSYAPVKAVLDKIIAVWTAGNGAPPDFPTAHKSAFAWDTAANLLSSSARGLPMIQPAIIGKVGLGETSNFVVALAAGVGGFPRMPFGGLDSNTGTFLDPKGPEIATIVAWIEGGCLP